MPLECDDDDDNNSVEIVTEKKSSSSSSSSQKIQNCAISTTSQQHPNSSINRNSITATQTTPTPTATATTDIASTAAIKVKRHFRPRPDHPKAWTFSSLCDPNRVILKKDLKRKVNYDLLTTSTATAAKKTKPQPPQSSNPTNSAANPNTNNNNPASNKGAVLVWEDAELSISIWSRHQTQKTQPQQQRNRPTRTENNTTPPTTPTTTMNTVQKGFHPVAVRSMPQPVPVPVVPSPLNDVPAATVVPAAVDSNSHSHGTTLTAHHPAVALMNGSTTQTQVQMPEQVVSNSHNVKNMNFFHNISDNNSSEANKKTRTRIPSRASEEAWQKRLEELIEYKAEHGDCLVPKLHPENQRLGDWVGSQRQQYKKRERGEKTPLTDDRFLELDRLGFVWAVRKRNSTGKSVSWEERFKSLVHFTEKYGHCNVPNNWSVDQKLSNWCCNQRTAYRMKQQGRATAGKITNARIEALEAIGFEWVRSHGSGRGRSPRGSSSGAPVVTVENASWDHYFRALVDYKAKFGHFSISEDLVEYKELRNWMCTQRYLYNVTAKSNKGNNGSGASSVDDFKESLISKERVDRLEQIGFVWSEQIREESLSSTLESDTVASKEKESTSIDS